MMSKRIFVVGGSYFLGRVFCLLTKGEGDFALTLVNRGRYSMSSLPNVTEYRCDRHDAAALRAIPGGHYDAIVDFCGYSAGDIRTLLENCAVTADRYIFISTADVYQRNPWTPPDETAPLLTEFAPGQVGDYLRGKVELERELGEACAARGMSATVFRPAFLYGPYNYAMREAYFFQKMLHGEIIPFPTDATATFQFVYVKDAAQAVIAAIRAARPGIEAFNLAAPEALDYGAFFDTLRRISGLPVETAPVTVREVLEQNIPLPFPLTDGESERYDGEKVCRELGVTYTPFEEGLSRTYQAMKPIFTDR